LARNTKPQKPISFAAAKSPRCSQEGKRGEERKGEIKRGKERREELGCFRLLRSYLEIERLRRRRRGECERGGDDFDPRWAGGENEK
jgi:hypothetical protein